MISQDTIESILTSLDKQIGICGSAPIALAVCGGTALFALHLIARTTRDVDVLGEVVTEEGEIKLRRIDKFSKEFLKASKVVQRDFGLPDRWLNRGPELQLDTGLPAGFEKRLAKKTYGEYLTVYFISRLDQIHFKLYAALDRGGYHVDDLFALKPTKNEIEMAARWVLTQDVSEGFKLILKDFLRKKGFNDVSGRI